MKAIDFKIIEYFLSTQILVKSTKFVSRGHFGQYLNIAVKSKHSLGALLSSTTDYVVFPRLPRKKN